MPKQYCEACGAANDYSLTPPSHCTKCQQNLNVSTAASVSAPLAAPRFVNPTTYAPLIPVAPAVQTSPQPFRPAYGPGKRAAQAYTEEELQEIVDPPDRMEVEIQVTPLRRVSLGQIMQGEKSEIDVAGKNKMSEEQKETVRQRFTQRMKSRTSQEDYNVGAE